MSRKLLPTPPSESTEAINQEILTALKGISGEKGKSVFKVPENLAGWVHIAVLLGGFIGGYAVLNNQVTTVTKQYTELSQKQSDFVEKVQKKQEEIANSAQQDRNELAKTIKESVDKQTEVNMKFSEQLTRIQTILEERGKHEDEVKKSK